MNNKEWFTDHHMVQADYKKRRVDKLRNCWLKAYVLSDEELMKVDVEMRAEGGDAWFQRLQMTANLCK